MRHSPLLMLCVLMPFLVPPALGQDVAVPLPQPRPEAGPGKAPVPLPRPRPVAASPDAPTEATPEAEAPEAPALEAEPSTAEEAVAADEAGAEADDAPADVADTPPVPPRIYQSGCPAVITGQVSAELLPPIAEQQCGVQSPWLVSAVAANGRMVPLSSDATMSCEMAGALPGWVADIDSYLWARDNTRVAEVMTGTSYFCRNVNNAKSGNLSFHSFANALDVVGLRLEDGRTVTVAAGWDDALSSEGRLLRFAHGSACARFTTTLGPEANALHEDHLHLDMGCHGKACTARLCE
jgi:hypothetical protein